MSKYLISTRTVYRVDSESEVENTINEAKRDNHYILSKYTSEFKEVKEKGEVVDSFYKVTLDKIFNEDIKNPISQIDIVYQEDDYAD